MKLESDNNFLARAKQFYERLGFVATYEGMKRYCSECSGTVDMQGGIVDILTILDDVYAQVLGLTIAIVTLLLIHPIFALILIAWVAVFLAITFLFLKSTQNLSHVFAEARSSLVGKMVDSISNLNSPLVNVLAPK